MLPRTKMRLFGRGTIPSTLDAENGGLGLLPI